MATAEMKQDARQNAAEVMKCGIIDVSMCKDCNDKGTLFDVDTVTISTQNYFQFCNVCCRFQETPYLVEVTVESVVSYDICDCIEMYGRIRHHNGGNYHHTVYRISKSEVLI